MKGFYPRWFPSLIPVSILSDKRTFQFVFLFPFCSKLRALILVSQAARSCQLRLLKILGMHHPNRPFPKTDQKQPNNRSYYGVCVVALARCRNCRIWSNHDPLAVMLCACKSTGYCLFDWFDVCRISFTTAVFSLRAMPLL